MTLVGHEKPVVALAAAPNGLLVSGSWDFTARVWRGAECVHELRGHTQAVWAVLALSATDVLTASADKTIKLWRDGKCIHTYEGHSDAVRALQAIEGVGFLSGSNDGSLRVWTLSGECVGEYYGHASFVFAVAAVPGTNLIASASEDHTVKLWHQGKCVQTLQHPTTVWSVAGLENGDVVTGCADGIARVWSARPEAALPADQLAAYQAKVTNVPIAKGSIGDLNVEKLPGREALETPGRTEGDRLMVRNGNTVEVYLWDSAQSQWTKFGEVVDAASTPAKSLQDGREYDYVFDVDLGDGLPARKLGYNATDNPWTAAQQFLWREELPQDYLDQVANFIITNSTPVTLGQGSAGPTYQDPFTGGNRYVPGSSTSTQSGAGLDPFTGASSYRSSSAPAPAPPAPTTLSTTNGSSTAPSPYVHFPNRAMVYFDQSNFDGISKKLNEFSAQLASSGSDQAGKALSADGRDAGLVDSLIRTLKDTSRYHATTFASDELRVVSKLLTWPAPMRFPVLDLVRSMAVHQSGAAYFAQPAVWNVLEGVLLESLKDTAVVPNQMLALRVLANLFHFTNTRTLVVGRAEVLLEAAADTARSANKNVRLSLITLLLNFAVHLLGQPQGNAADVKLQTVSIIAEMLGAEAEDEEVLYRVLVTLGTLVTSDAATAGLAKDLDIPASLHRLASAATTGQALKSRAAAAELSTCLQDVRAHCSS